MDPVDLATIISYETAGSFDPLKRGPTTQWGEHRGLIQFGEPQAEQYGVNWNDPINSQLGEGGAVERYFRSAGYEPGMGLLDAYSAVNAGRVGLYNRTDANNGGAPGTVRDKVENQMEGHRRNAVELLGGNFALPPMPSLANEPAPMMGQMQPADPFEGMGLLSRFAASRGIAQDADASPIANLLNIFTQKEDPRLKALAQQRGGFMGLLGF